MPSDELTHRVITAIAKVLGVPAEDIQPDSTFEELGVDSLDGINIAFALEETFDVEIPDEAVHGFADVRQVTDELRKLVADPGEA